MRFARDGVSVGHQLVAQVEIFPANRLDLGVVQFGRIGRRARFNRAGLAGVPAPRQMQMPGASMRTERRTKRGEFKPARVKLAGVFAIRGWDKIRRCPCPKTATRSARNSCPTLHLRRQSFPARNDVAGPNPAAITRDARRAIALQIPRTHIRPVAQRAFVIHPMPRQPARHIEPIAFVRPPAVHAGGEQCSWRFQ